MIWMHAQVEATAWSVCVFLHTLLYLNFADELYIWNIPRLII